MAKKKTEERTEMPAITLESVTTELTALKVKVRRMSDNWKRFVKTHVDSSSNGTIVSLLLVCLLVLPAFGEDVANWDAGTDRSGTAVLSHDGTDYTMTVDEFAGSGSGLTGFTVTLGDNVSSLQFTNGVNLGTCYLDFFVDSHDDAGDYSRLLFPSTGGMLFQSDVSSKGTLATKITITSAGAVTLPSTLGVTGVGTFTAQSIHTAGINADGDIDIDFSANTEEMVITTAVNPDVAAGGGMLTLYDAEDADGANSAYLLRLASKKNGSSNNEFILCEDNSDGTAGNGDTMFAVDAGGDVTVAGTLDVTGAGTVGGALAVTGVATFTGQDVHDGGIDINEDVDIDFDNADEEVSIVNTAEYGADGAQVTIQNTDADVGAAMYLLRMRYTDDGQANADFLVCEDNNGDDMVAITDGGDITAAGIITSAEAITLTDADGAAVITATGYDDSNASLVLDADNGDDNADTWTITSEQSGNDLSILNHATEVLNLTSAGALQIDGDLTVTGNDIISAAAKMTIAGATSTSLDLGAAGITTTVLGPLEVLEATSKGIDTTGAGALYIGQANATSMVLGASDCVVTSTAAMYAPKIGIAATTGYFSVVSTTQLVFVAESGATTNVIDADITTP